MFREPRLFFSLATLAKTPREQAGSRKLRHGRNGRQSRPIRCPARLADRNPLVFCQIRKELTTNRNAHAIDDDHEHRAFSGDRSDKLFQDPFDRNNVGPWEPALVQSASSSAKCRDCRSRTIRTASNKRA